MAVAIPFPGNSRDRYMRQAVHRRMISISCRLSFESAEPLHQRIQDYKIYSNNPMPSAKIFDAQVALQPIENGVQSSDGSG
jgi:hypothetical protein